MTATQTGESVTELIFCEDMSAMDGGGFEVVLDIRDGRTVADVGEEDEVDTIEIVNPLVESQKENTRVSIRPLPGRRNEFTVDFSTRHYAFSCCRSQTVRSLESFYQLHTILKVSLRNILATFFLFFQTCHLYAAIPSLPLKPVLWVTRSASQVRRGIEERGDNLYFSPGKGAGGLPVPGVAGQAVALKQSSPPFSPDQTAHGGALDITSNIHPCSYH